MNAGPKNFEGVIPILVSPFLDDGSLDLDSLERVVGFMADLGVDGVTVLGILGEANRMVDADREAIIKSAVKAAGGMPVVVGTSHSGTMACLELCKMAQGLGASAVMITPQKEPVPNPERIVELYRTVGGGMDLPIILQDHPASTNVHMPVPLMLRIMEEVPTIACVKEEAVPSPQKLTALFEGMTGRKVPVLVGLGALYGLFDLERGAAGFNTGFAFPEVLMALVRAARAGDWNRVRGLYTRFFAAHRVRAAARPGRAQGDIPPARANRPQPGPPPRRHHRSKNLGAVAKAHRAYPARSRHHPADKTIARAPHGPPVCQTEQKIKMTSSQEHSLHGWLSAVRRDFHSHPETAFEEHRTTARIKEILTGLGVELGPLPGLETGALGIIRCERPGPVLAIRADIDALAMVEESGANYASKTKGRMHGCGHDGHAAILLGVAKAFVESGLKNKLCGELRLVFQPAEEQVAGAERMIKAGCLENPRVDRILALHLNPGLEAGFAGFHGERSHAAGDILTVEIIGKGAHGAQPHKSADPVVAAGHFITAIQSVVSRSLDPQKAGVVTIGSLQAGDAANVIPRRAVMKGTVRTFDPEVRERIARRLDDIAEGVGKAFEAEIKLDLKPVVPVCRNDLEVEDSLKAAASEALGPDRLVDLTPTMGSEDFGHYSRVVPGAMFNLGCGDKKNGIVHSLHSPFFDMDERCLPMGVEIFMAAAKKYLA